MKMKRRIAQVLLASLLALGSITALSAPAHAGSGGPMTIECNMQFRVCEVIFPSGGIEWFWF